MKNKITLSFFIIIFVSNITAKEIKLNKIYLNINSNYSLELKSKDLIDIDELIIKTKIQKYNYKINEHLLFCEGEEDGCNNTGVFIKKFDFYPNELIFLSALKGAHSKVLYIFDPKIDEINPIKTYTGAYYLDYLEKKDYLEISYDKYCDKEDPCEVIERFK